MSETIVGQGSPTVTWATPSPITYGTALSASQLDAATTVAGTITYTPAAGTVLSAGTDTLSVVFTPTDTTDYLPSTTTVTLAVNPAALQITASSTTMGYGGSPPSVTASYAGFVNGDNSSSLAVQPSCITSATGSTSVGSHLAANTCLGAVDANYTMSYVPGNVTVVAPFLTSNFKSFTIKSDRKTTLTLACASATCTGTYVDQLPSRYPRPRGYVVHDPSWQQFDRNDQPQFRWKAQARYHVKKSSASRRVKDDTRGRTDRRENIKSDLIVSSGADANDDSVRSDK